LRLERLRSRSRKVALFTLARHPGLDVDDRALRMMPSAQVVGLSTLNSAIEKTFGRMQ